MTGRTYKAFISYAHVDSAWASWIQKSLETYIPPKSVRHKTSLKKLRPLSPIFRDTEDFAADHNLSDQIQTALTSSEYLVLVCSPAAAQSRWVNEEIRLFRDLHGDAKTLCVLVNGTPETAFPPALTDNGRREPLAANPQKHGDGKKLARTKLAAGLLGVPLDDLIQREAQRKYRRVMAVTVLSVIGMLFTSLMTFTAVQARKEATARKGDAEGLIEFMLTDLKEKLEPVGRLDVLDAVGNEAVKYYEAQDVSNMDDSSLARRAKAFSLLSEIDRREGNLESAVIQANKATTATQELLRQNPNNPQRIFNHAQAIFWRGFANYTLGHIDLSEHDFVEYNRLANRLIILDPENIDWTLEVGYSENNLADLYARQGKYLLADQAFQAALKAKKKYLNHYPNKKSAQLSVASTMGSLAGVKMHSSSLDEAKALVERQLNLYAALKEQYPNDFTILRDIVVGNTRLAKIHFMAGEIEPALAIIRGNIVRAELLTQRDTDSFRNSIYHAGELLSLRKICMLDQTVCSLKELEDKYENLLEILPDKFTDSTRWQFRVALLKQRQDIIYASENSSAQEKLRLVSAFKFRLDKLQTLDESTAQKPIMSYNYVFAQIHEHAALIELGRKVEAAKLAKLISENTDILTHTSTHFEKLKLHIFEITGDTFNADKTERRLRERGNAMEPPFRQAR